MNRNDEAFNNGAFNFVRQTKSFSGGANAKPPEIRILKLLMLGFSLLGVAGVTTGIFLLRSGHPGWAVIAATAPTVVILIVFILSLIFEW